MKTKSFRLLSFIFIFVIFIVIFYFYFLFLFFIFIFLFFFATFDGFFFFLLMIDSTFLEKFATGFFEDGVDEVDCLSQLLFVCLVTKTLILKTRNSQQQFSLQIFLFYFYFCKLLFGKPVSRFKITFREHILLSQFLVHSVFVFFF